MSDQYMYILSKGIKIFIGGFRQNLASIITLATLIFMYLAVFSVNFSVAKAVGSATDSRTLRVFIAEDSEPEKFKDTMIELGLNSDIRFYDRADAKQRVIDRAPDSKNLEELPEDLFPRFFELTSDNLTDIALADAAAKMEQTDGVKSVESGKKQNEKMQKIKRVSYVFVTLLTVLTGISSCFIIFNTIRLSLYRHHRAIMLYTLVGATRFFITMPYVAASKIEATLAFILAYLMNKFFISFLTAKLLAGSFFTLVTPGPWFSLFLYIVLMFITAFSAIFSVVTFLMGQKSVNEV